MAASFTRSAFGSLYWSGPGAPAVGYLLPSTAQAEETISLADSWTQHAGCYVFVDTAVAADASTQEAFARALWSLLADPGLTGTRFVWASDPVEPAQPVVAAAIVLDGPPNQAGIAIVRRLARFDMRDVALAVVPGCQVALTPDGSGFAIIPAQGRPRGVYLTVRDDTTTLDVVVGELRVPVGGERSGCLCFTARLGTTDGVDDLDHLDVGLRVFFTQPFGTPATGGEPFFLDSLRYPVFADPEVTLSATLDPVRPLEAARTWFAVTATSTTPSVRSHYRTPFGHTVTLTPGHDARLVFATRPTDSTVGPDSPLYLVPSGDFKLGVDPQPPTGAGGDLMCGFSGVEYLKLAPEGTDTLRFVPGQPAFAPAFVPGQPPKAEITPALTSLATTSWSYVRHHSEGMVSADTVTYCAQPDSSVLHQPPAAVAGGDQAVLLSYLEVVSSRLPYSPSPTAPPAFPLLPYAAITAERGEDYAALEKTVVGPCRRDTIFAITTARGGEGTAEAATAGGVTKAQAPPAAGVDIVGVTPQGFRASFTPDYTAMTEVTLAVNDVDNNPAPVRLLNIPRGSPLWTAFYSNQLFLVITDPDAVRPYIDANGDTLIADGWPFCLNPDTWRPLNDTQPTFLVIKYIDKSFRDVAGQLSAWCMAATFNKDPATTFTALETFIKDALAHRSPEPPPEQPGATSPQDPDYAHFVDTVLSDPTWNGIVILNAATDINAWPPQLRGLAAGINPSKLVAHHAGVHATTVRTVVDEATKTASLVARPSSIFALIHYQDPDPLPASPVPYDFKVLSLKIRIENTTIANFSSSVTFQINTLFAEPCTLADGTANNLVLEGFYENSNGQPTYVFLTDKHNVFTLTSAVVHAVVATRAQFVTVTHGGGPTPHEPTPPPPIETRLLLWGLLDFAALEGFDAFSFGSAASQAPGTAGLAIANLAVAMTTYPSADPKQQAAKLFAFDAAHMTFDLARSTPRATSLYDTFPLQLASFQQTDISTAPTDLGYAAISTPLHPGLLTPPWFGLCLTLELGTLGAWAEPGRLDARLLIAWSPSDSGNANVVLGLSLPGLSGSKREFDLQGPLKLTIKNIAIERTTDGGYVLWFQSLALSVFRLTFPPTGRIDLLLFAGRDAASKKAIGWYAAYDKTTPTGTGPAGSGATTINGTRLKAAEIPANKPPGGA